MPEPRLVKMRFYKHIKEPKNRVFLCDYLKTFGKDKENDVYLSIEEILDIWGYGSFYDEMVDNLYRHVKNDADERICVNYEMGAFNDNKEEQKLLEWNIYDERERKFGLTGGILFHNNEMSFHT